MASKLDAEKATLASGRYLVKVYVDLQHHLWADPTALLGENEFYGQAEIQARSREGFQQAEMLSATAAEKVVLCEG